MTLDAPGGPFGYLRIFGFDEEPAPFIDELIRLIPLLPDRGLIIDIRGNPGGYIWAAELALQLFTPNRIEPTAFSTLATPFTRQIASIGDVAEDLAPVEALAGRRGPQRRALCADHSDYGSRGVQRARADVWRSGGPGGRFHHVFIGRPLLRGLRRQPDGPVHLRRLGDRCRRCQRLVVRRTAEGAHRFPGGAAAASRRHRPVVRVPARDARACQRRHSDRGCRHLRQLVRDDAHDLLNGNPDLIATCITALKQQPFSRLTSAVDTAARTIHVTTTGLDLVDVKFDGHSGVTAPVDAAGSVTITYPPRTKTVELTGCLGPDTLQRRRLSLRS
jgi:hypothetical protein